VVMFELKSELMGMVWKIPVAVGQTLSAGDTVAILESMKVEIPIVAPMACSLVELRVEEGSEIAEGQTIAILRPT